MDVTPLIPAGRQIIESYGDFRFRVSGKLYQGSVLIFLDRTLPWAVEDGASITLASLAEIGQAGEAGAVEVLLLGCGRRAVLVAAELRASLRRSGIVIEPMDTGAAARTYNVLAAEGRRVAAALIATA
jgi:uncharacterized protein